MRGRGKQVIGRYFIEVDDADAKKLTVMSANARGVPPAQDLSYQIATDLPFPLQHLEHGGAKN
ncbi:hypothetical protein A7E78_13345 [Syntrophotalea acetylenivorans]|uniref:Uncharacterized protein n=1 Tax=Syntrophotalea acetylenivorans TaxID=1842532 RepID=A0A1L3GS85_9BACT|nr:hypothetical protein A7E78_13345 [Syntrophotalea acetylenivorans]